VTSSKGDHLETEQKYDADADFVLPELGNLPDLDRRQATEPRRIYLSATYFDTEDQRLIRHKVTLRRRVGGDDEGWHLKLPAGKDTRQEVHAPLDEGNTGSAPARLTERVEEITAGEQLRPVALLDTERTVVTLAGSAGDDLLEVADDLVTAVRFGARDSEPMRWREIEVEVLTPGDEATALLKKVGTVLREAGARPSASGSKLARVLGTG
jgi:inorganic triphosphatase YgiF